MRNERTDAPYSTHTGLKMPKQTAIKYHKAAHKRNTVKTESKIRNELMPLFMTSTQSKKRERMINERVSKKERQRRQWSDSDNN